MKKYMGKVKGKALLFSNHVLLRSHKRAVPVSSIKQVIANPQITYSSPTGSTHLEAIINGKKIVTMVNETSKAYEVLTCWSK